MFQSHRRESSLTVGDVLFDATGRAYRVVILDNSEPAGDVTESELGVRPIEESSADSHGLTRRQRQIAGLLVNRATNAEIAGTLGISVHTARHHSQRVLEKLGISSRSEVRRRLTR